jgi:hypothetical protein
MLRAAARRTSSSARRAGWAIADAAAFVGEPEAKGFTERWIQDLKERCLWARLYGNVDGLCPRVAELVKATTPSGYSAPRARDAGGEGYFARLTVGG